MQENRVGAPSPGSPAAGYVGRPAWILVLLIVALVIGAVNVGVYLYGLTLPADWQAEATIDIAAPPAVVYDQISTPEAWADWSAWSRQHDPSMHLDYTQPADSEGPTVTWMGQQVGQGRLTITEAVPDQSIRYTLILQGQEFSKNGRFTLVPVNGGTRVVWTDGGQVEGTLGRLFRERLEQSVTIEFNASLARLKTTIESASAKAETSEAAASPDS